MIFLLKKLLRILNKVLIIGRVEFLNRITKKSFLWLTLIGPLIIAIIMIVPIGMAMKSSKNYTIEVLDLSEQHIFYNLPFNKDKNYINMNGSQESILANFLLSNNDALIVIPPSVNGNVEIKLYQHISLSKSTIQSITSDLNAEIANFVSNEIKNANPKLAIWLKGVQIQSQTLAPNNSFSETAFIFALTGAMAIYIFIFVYGVQVMRSIVEDKTSRIVEIIITSVRPVQLMAGKILGVGLTGLLQFFAWLTLSFFIIFPIYKYFKIERFTNEQIVETLKYVGDTEQALEINYILNGLASIQLPIFGICFLLYFLLGFLIYAGLFSCVGAMVDSETDSQQFVVPITAPMVGTILLMQLITQEPDSALSLALSMFPLTSPIAMMLRLPFGVNSSEIFYSITILGVSAVLVLIMAGKIYQTGVLMYGKKATLAEVFKWLVQKS